MTFLAPCFSKGQGKPPRSLSEGRGSLDGFLPPSPFSPSSCGDVPRSHQTPFLHASKTIRLHSLGPPVNLRPQTPSLDFTGLPSQPKPFRGLPPHRHRDELGLDFWVSSYKGGNPYAFGRIRTFISRDSFSRRVDQKANGRSTVELARLVAFTYSNGFSGRRSIPRGGVGGSFAAASNATGRRYHNLHGCPRKKSN